MCNKKSTIIMAKNPIFHSRTKYIAIKSHLIRDAKTNKKIDLKYCKDGEADNKYLYKSIVTSKVRVTMRYAWSIRESKLRSIES